MQATKNKPGPKSKATTAKELASQDRKQMVLSASWTLGLAPAAKLPDALPAAPSKPKAPGYRPHPLGRPRPEADNVIALEVNACVHRLIDVIILDHEKQTLVIETECRSAINSIIDQVVLNAESNPFFASSPCVGGTPTPSNVR
jgi:hypothetical protein